MNNYINNKPHDSYGFKKEVKIKHDAVKVIVGRFSNGTASMMVLLKQNLLALTWVDYCVMVSAIQLMWEER